MVNESTSAFPSDLLPKQSFKPSPLGVKAFGSCRASEFPLFKKLTLIESMPWQPLSFMGVTKKVVVVFKVAIGLKILALFKKAAGVYTYFVAPKAFNCAND
jgi:hypothetical protein